MKFIRRKRNLLLHLTMAFVGGGTSAYALMVRGNFGQAQTANLTELFIHLLVGDDYLDVLYRLGAFLLFMLALAISHVLKRKVPEEILQMVTFIVELLCVLITGFLPMSLPNMLALWPVFTMAGFQWGAFAGADGFNCSTIFCSNNCKQALFGWMDYHYDKKRRSFEQGRFYTATVCFFYTGTCAFVFLTMHLKGHAIWFEVAPILAAISIWYISGSTKRLKKKPFVEGASNIKRGSNEL